MTDYDALLARLSQPHALARERDAATAIRTLRAQVVRWKMQSDDWQKRGWEIGTQLDAALSEIDDLTAQRDKWRNAMQSWTPSGSEFTTPEACSAFVAMRREDEHRAKCDAVRSQRTVADLTAQRDVLRGLLLEVRGGIIEGSVDDVESWERRCARALSAPPITEDQT